MSRHAAASSVCGFRNSTNPLTRSSQVVSDCTATPASASSTTEIVTARNATYNVTARRPSLRATVVQRPCLSLGPYTMPRTAPDSTTNTSAAVTVQNRSYENQLKSDDSLE